MRGKGSRPVSASKIPVKLASGSPMLKISMHSAGMSTSIERSDDAKDDDDGDDGDDEDDGDDDDSDDDDGDDGNTHPYISMHPPHPSTIQNAPGNAYSSCRRKSEPKSRIVIRCIAAKRKRA